MTAIDHADALDWLATQEPGSATAVIFDPPYAVGTPVRGREGAWRTCRATQAAISLLSAAGWI